MLECSRRVGTRRSSSSHQKIAKPTCRERRVHSTKTIKARKWPASFSQRQEHRATPIFLPRTVPIATSVGRNEIATGNYANSIEIFNPSFEPFFSPLYLGDSGASKRMTASLEIVFAANAKTADHREMKMVLRTDKPDDDVPYLRKRKGFIIRAALIRSECVINNAAGIL